MIITDKFIKSFVEAKEGKKDDICVTTIDIDRSNINSISLKQVYSNIEYLSLQNNNIVDINFLNNLTNIWYLDLRNNPIESFDVLNSLNTFGFLGISIEKYSEKKILNIKRINVGVLNLLLEDNYKKAFLTHNPNIIKFNDEIMYYNERVNFFTNNMNVNLPNNFSPSRKLSNELSSVKSFGSNSNFSFSPKTFKHQKTSLASNFSNFLQPLSMAPPDEINFRNEKVKMLYSFFESYNTELTSILSNPLSLISNANSLFFLENFAFLKEEKKKLIVVMQIYESFLVLNKNTSSILTLQNHTSYTNQFTNKFHDFSILKVKEVPIQIIILTILVLYILQIITKDIVIVILKHIYKTFLHISIPLKTNDIKSLLETEVEYLLGIYFDIYDDFSENYNKHLSPFDIDPKYLNIDKLKYAQVIKSLEMNSLILKCNILSENKIAAQKIYQTKNELNSRKISINIILIKLIDEKLKIFEEILNLIQYLSDFIVFNKLDTLLLKEYTFHYRVFIEIRELMFQHLNRKTKDNLIFNSLSDRKYTDHRFKRFGNKLYFFKNPNKEDKDEGDVFQFITGKTKKKIFPKMSDIKKETKTINPDDKNYTFLPKNKFEKSRSDFLMGKKIQSNINKNTISSNSEIEEGQTKTLFRRNMKFKTVSQSGEHNFNYSNISEGHDSNLISPAEVDSLLKTSRMSIVPNPNKTDSFRGRKKLSHSQVELPFNNKDKNELKLLLDDDILKLYVKILLKKDKNQKQAEILKDKENQGIISKSRSTYTLFNQDSKQLSNSSILPNMRKITKKFTSLKHRMEDGKVSFYKNLSPSINKAVSCDLTNPSTTKITKTIYDFKSNLKKLTHHWNENNSRTKYIQKFSAKENEYLRNNKKFFTTKKVEETDDNCMSAEDIINLFSIENKNEDLKSRTVNTKNKKYTIKSQSLEKFNKKL